MYRDATMSTKEILLKPTLSRATEYEADLYGAQHTRPADPLQENSHRLDNAAT